ncbi:MAG: hypothetical protein ABH827_01735 [bacterium]
MYTILSDSGQTILAEDVQLILNMSNDRFINEHNNLEYRYSDQDVADHYDISLAELDRCKHTLSYEANFNFIIEDDNKEPSPYLLSGDELLRTVLARKSGRNF